jgi:hypothetical protein
LVRPKSIFLGKFAEIDILLQFESAFLCCAGIERLVRPASILMGKLAAIDILVQFEPAT